MEGGNNENLNRQTAGEIRYIELIWDASTPTLLTFLFVVKHFLPSWITFHLSR